MVVIDLVNNCKLFKVSEFGSSFSNLVSLLILYCGLAEPCTVYGKIFIGVKFYESLKM